MLNNLRILCVCVFITFSCVDKVTVQNKSSDEKKPIESVLYGVIEKMNELLPENVTSDHFIRIYRIGSIEFSSSCTFLALPINELKDSVIEAYYFSFNINVEGDVIDQSQPIVIGHRLKLKNAKKYDIINLDSLKKVSLDQLDEYVLNRKAPYTGEWHCGNVFLINPNRKSVKILDINSRSLERVFFSSLYMQISPSEYFQSFSLHHNCSEQGALLRSLKTRKNTQKFAIDYNLDNTFW